MPWTYRGRAVVVGTRRGKGIGGYGKQTITTTVLHASFGMSRLIYVSLDKLMAALMTKPKHGVLTHYGALLCIWAPQWLYFTISSFNYCVT
jgi:hypothetical protein